MILAHFTDIHVGRPEDYGAPGQEEWRARAVKHSEELLDRLLADLASHDPDHVALTGDLTMTSEREQFERARAAIDRRLPGMRVTVLPGNHDRWTAETMQRRDFEHFFGDWLRCDVKGDSAFPICHLVDGLALVSLDSSPFVPDEDPAWVKGWVDPAQLRNLEALAGEPEVQKRALVVLLHHHVQLSDEDAVAEDPKDPTPLTNADEVLATLAKLPVALVLHGHRHKQMRLDLSLGGREVPVLCPGSATRVDQRKERTARYSLYEIDDAGLRSVRTRAYDPDRDRFVWTDGAP